MTNQEPANLRHLWDKLKNVPPTAQKTIGGGRLKGMTDIKPQWRYERMTEVFGPCGWGWRYEIAKQWLEPCAATGEVAAMVNVNLYICGQQSKEWSHAIPGTGGSMFIAAEKHGPYCSDEAFKMALTDALSVAMKMIGVAAEVYMGHGVNDGGSKYEPRAKTKAPAAEKITTTALADLTALCKTAYPEDTANNVAKLCKWAMNDETSTLDKINMTAAKKIRAHLEAK